MECVGIIASVFIAVATGVYVWLTNRILQVNQKAMLEQTRPYVIVDFVLIDNSIFLRISNLGTRGAVKVRCNIEPNLESILIRFENSLSYLEDFLNREYLPPKTEEMCFVNHIQNLTNEQLYFKVNIKYEDNLNTKYEENYSLGINKQIWLRNAFGPQVGG